MERRNWLAPILLVLGFLGLDGAATLDMVLGLGRDESGAGTFEVLRGVFLGVGIALLAAGLAVAWVRGRIPPGVTLRWYSILLGCLGGLALGLAALYEVVPTGHDRTLESAFLFTQRVLGVYGVLLLSAAGLRFRKSRLAFPATAAAGLAMLVFFPLGTAVSIVWLVRVEPTERLPSNP